MDHIEHLKRAGSKGGKAGKGSAKRRPAAHYRRMHEAKAAKRKSIDATN